MFKLDWLTPPEWVLRVEREPLLLLSDHAHCEIAAATTSQALIVRNPGRRELVERLSAMAREEMEHFSRVVGELYDRGGVLGPRRPNPYAEALHARATATRGAVLLDRLLVAGLIEARSLERFHLLSEHLADRALAGMFRDLMASEARHQALFGRLAGEAFDGRRVAERAAELCAIEGQVAATTPFDYRVHGGIA